MKRQQYTNEQKIQILEMIDKQQLTYSETAKIMKLSNSKARSLYQCAQRSKKLKQL